MPELEQQCPECGIMLYVTCEDCEEKAMDTIPSGDPRFSPKSITATEWCYHCGGGYEKGALSDGLCDDCDIEGVKPEQAPPPSLYAEFLGALDRARVSKYGEARDTNRELEKRNKVQEAEIARLQDEINVLVKKLQASTIEAGSGKRSKLKEENKRLNQKLEWLNDQLGEMSDTLQQILALATNH